MIKAEKIYKETIYLDYAAATPLSPEVLAVMQPFLTEYFYNPSASYNAAREVRQTVDQARTDVAHYLGVRSNEIIFTAGGTEANNLAVDGIMRQYPDANIVVSKIEHESVLVPARQHDYREVSVLSDGIIDLIDLRQKIDSKTVLVSIMYANNEIGTVQSLREIAKIIKEKRIQRGTQEYPLYFHSDACQASQYLDLHTNHLGLDMMSLGGGKIYGPKQSGILYVKASTRINPIISGGGQEYGLRSGTENVASIRGFATALSNVQDLRQIESRRIHEIQKLFISLISTKIPRAKLNGSRRHRLVNNIHFTFPDQDNERLLIELDQRGIQAAAGSACSASNEEPSHVLKALGLSDADARSSLRFTMGRQTTTEQIVKVVDIMAELVN